jgi:hypothetical protein
MFFFDFFRHPAYGKASFKGGTFSEEFVDSEFILMNKSASEVGRIFFFLMSSSANPSLVFTRGVLRYLTLWAMLNRSNKQTRIKRARRNKLIVIMKTKINHLNCNSFKYSYLKSTILIFVVFANVGSKIFEQKTGKHLQKLRWFV